MGFGTLIIVFFICSCFSVGVCAISAMIIMNHTKQIDINTWNYLNGNREKTHAFSSPYDGARMDMFLKKKEYKALNDSKLNRYCQIYRIFWISYFLFLSGAVLLLIFVLVK